MLFLSSWSAIASLCGHYEVICEGNLHDILTISNIFFFFGILLINDVFVLIVIVIINFFFS